jgi:hypothetical protein
VPTIQLISILKQKNVSLLILAVLGTVDMLGMSQTTKLEGNVLEPRLARIILGTQRVRQPQRDVIPLDHTTEVFLIDGKISN